MVQTVIVSIWLVGGHMSVDDFRRTKWTFSGDAFDVQYM